MIGFLRKVVPLLIMSVVLLSTSAFAAKQFGGEIPWPLSVQHVMTVQNSKGLWRLENKSESRLFNVEMNSDTRSGFDWIRVSELNTKTYEVISWGEGLFTPSKLPNTPDSSYSSINIDAGVGNDKFGRYISMFPNGDLSKAPYLVRMVEVETTLGNVLGLSLLNYQQMKFEHMLGTRVLSEPLGCMEMDKKEALKCYLDL